MKNSKLQSQTGENDIALKIAGKIVDWHAKNEFLKIQISALEKSKSLPVFTISCFLLKTQLIEFELKQLITSLDLHSFFANHSKILKRKTRTPKDLDDKKMTLGTLKEEIYQYEGEFLDDLKKNLSKLVMLRNDFVHKLFNPGTISELVKKSDDGLELTNKIILSIEKVEGKLKKHDPIKN